MEWGQFVPNGALPVYSVADEVEAKALVVLACPTNLRGAYVAPELVQAQTLENLYSFSDRLDAAHDVLRQHGQCRCKIEATSAGDDHE